MIPIRIDDDDDEEPDIIDLTVSHGYYESPNFPIRPPTPFADSPIWPPIVPQQHNANGIIIWPSSTKNHEPKTNTYLSLNRSSSVSRPNSTWRRTLNKLLKRTKSDEPKKVMSSRTSDSLQHYNFGIGETNQKDLTLTRNNVKRVHWIDDDEMVLNLCHRFVEYLKLFVQNTIDDKNEDRYFKNCQITLEELDSLIDCQEIRQALEDIVELVNQRNKTQLVEQQIYIENLLSRTFLLSSA